MPRLLVDLGCGSDVEEPEGDMERPWVLETSWCHRQEAPVTASHCSSVRSRDMMRLTQSV